LAFIQQALAKMGAEKTGSTGDQDAGAVGVIFHWFYPNKQRSSVETKVFKKDGINLL